MRAVRSEGRRGRSGPVTVRALPQPEGECRVAFAVGRHAGSAVVRNRIRRRLRAILRDLARDGGLPAGSLLVTAGAPVATLPVAQVRADLCRALARALSRP